LTPARYPPLASTEVIQGYERAFGNLERDARARPARAAEMVDYLRRSAAATRDGTLKRYVLLRALVLARATGAPFETLDAIAQEVDPLLRGGTPAALVQTVELRAALAGWAAVPTNDPQREADFARRVAFGSASIDLLEWQLDHDELQSILATLRVARAAVRRSGSNDLGDRLAKAQQKTQLKAAATSATNGRRVVFVLDASGSMLNTLDRARVDILHLIEDLAREDSFTVMVSRDDGVEVFADVFMPASVGNIAAVRAYLADVSPRGTGDGQCGLEDAIAMRPDRICLISDGEVPTPDAMVSAARGEGRRIPVDTVAAPGASEAGVAVLKKVSAETGGVFRAAEGAR